MSGSPRASAGGWKSRFNDFGGFAYFDTANSGALPIAAAEAAREAIALKARPDRLTNELYFSLPAGVRARIARLFDCAERHVAVTTGAGAGINAVARGLDWRKGDRIVLPALEFPANLYPWLWLERRGVEIVEVAADDPSTGSVSPERLAEHVLPGTRVVAFSHVNYTHGGRLDPAPIVDAARRVGAVTVLDASQAAGMEPFALGASGVDVYVASGYKFLLGPYGTGLALFSERMLERLEVNEIVWWAVEGTEDFNNLPRGDIRLRDGARRFDAHETASFLNLAAWTAALDLVLEVGPERARAHAHALGDRVLAGLPTGFEPAGPLADGRRSHILTVRAASPEATAAAHRRLAETSVRVSLRGNRLRIAPHLFNDEDDVDRLLSALRATR